MVFSVGPEPSFPANIMLYVPPTNEHPFPDAAGVNVPGPMPIPNPLPTTAPVGSVQSDNVIVT